MFLYLCSIFMLSVYIDTHMQRIKHSMIFLWGKRLIRSNIPKYNCRDIYGL